MERKDFEKKYIAARSAAIGFDFKHLSDVQREAALTTSGPLLLLAGAGSGKTTVLVNRVANLIKYGCGSDSGFVPDGVSEDDLSFLEGYVRSGGKCQGPDDGFRVRNLCAVDSVEPWRIIAITFTNKAAGEMKARLEKMLGPGSEDIWASTFHSACVRILRRDIDKLGFDRSFAIYDTSDSAALMKRILKELDVEERALSHKTVLNYISRAKDAMTSAGEFLTSAEGTGDVRRKIIGRAYVEYENRMRSSNSLDFDDLILLTVLLFREHPDVLGHYQQRFKYILVDEYQDTNNLQYLLAAALAGGHGNICVVGDDDQSIYKFRGATIENILSFEDQFKDARVIRLEQNYRSTGMILNAANDVIRNNVGRKGKRLWTENEHGDVPSLHVLQNEHDEAQFVADKIISSAAEGRSWCEHAVLYRMNAQSNQFETAFKRNGIPFRVYGGTGFYERAEIKDMLAYLCLIHNPHDDVRLLRVINNPPRGIGNTTVGRLADLAAGSGKSVFDAIRDAQNHDSLKAAAGRLHLFADMVDDLRELADTIPLDELYDTLVSRTGYVRMLEEKGSDENLARIENVKELKSNIISFMADSGGSLFDFLSETALYTDLDRDDHSTDRVLMMTMHSAKGLEFDTVFVVGMEEGIFPGSRAIGEPGEMEEERRLCYVAMTRAMRRLFFTSTVRRMLFGKTSSAMPSRFVMEISGDNIEINEAPRSFGSFDFAASTEPRAGAVRRYDGSARFEKPQYAAPPTPRANVTPQFKKGDTVEHTAFGRGVITSLSPAGGDALLEIAFDASGTRRLMLKSAARYMTVV